MKHERHNSSDDKPPDRLPLAPHPRPVTRTREEPTMADTHIELDESVGEYPRALKQAVRNINRDMAVLATSFAAMDRMKDGDGSQASHFQEVVDLFGVQEDTGVTNLARAKLLFDELNSALNNSAALKQFLAIVG